ncbi:MAG: nitrous oxide reductase accessory protein NosL [Sulfuricurvum sp.]
MILLRRFLILLLFLVALASADEFTKRATVPPELVMEGAKKEWCGVCGMKIEEFYKTSHTAKAKDGKMRQYCSMRCLAVDLADGEIESDSYGVVDSASQKIIDAKSAHYVVDSDVQGTMSRVSKIAFASKDDAEDFNIEHGGMMMSFDEAFNMAKSSLEGDVEMLQARKTKQIYPMGKKIYEKKCKDLTLDQLSLNELKAKLAHSGVCGELKESELQPLSLYLWEVARFENSTTSNRIVVSKDEKCPVCGMFVYKYPAWATQIYYKDRHYSFDGVKDMMKYYFKHQEGVVKMLVSDYYSQKAIDAREAFFVVGSDVYGPMGDELIAFKSKMEARSFRLDHKGKKVLSFSEITPDLLKGL